MFVALHQSLRWILTGLVCAFAGGVDRVSGAEPGALPASLTPPPPETPRINGPGVFGVRPQAPFLYAIPASGIRPMRFAADDLPAGLAVDATSGVISGMLASPGEHVVILRATNARGAAERRFRIRCGEAIALTPPMGWNSWNCWAESVDQDKVLRSARAMIASGLQQHGWSYINIDDAWQGRRGGPERALQANEKFPDLAKLCAEIHALGLKAGIYSTPFVSSYARYPGGSSDDPQGEWSPALAEGRRPHCGKYSFAAADAKQWGAWGFDYLKYDWEPNDLPHVIEMSLALRASGRDIVYSLSNNAPLAAAADLARWANCWRTTADIRDAWTDGGRDFLYAVTEIGFAQDRWSRFAGPGHWNDPDMLVVGQVGWGPKLRPSRLTPDEQYAHISLWCLLSAPLLIGCDLERLDPFTLGLLTNDEVLAINQDALGRQAERVAAIGAVDVFMKELEDGSHALGFFNRGDQVQTVGFEKLQRLGLPGRKRVRDLWRQQDLPVVERTIVVSIPAHGVQLYRLWPLLDDTPSQ